MYKAACCRHAPPLSPANNKSAWKAKTLIACTQPKRRRGFTSFGQRTRLIACVNNGNHAECSYDLGSLCWKALLSLLLPDQHQTGLKAGCAGEQWLPGAAPSLGCWAAHHGVGSLCCAVGPVLSAKPRQTLQCQMQKQRCR